MSVTMVPASHRTLFAMVTMTVTMEKMNMDALTALVIQTAISAMMAPASHRTVFAMVSITVTMEKMNMDALQTCSSAQFQCNDGSCIPDYWLCDGINDCAGNEDENEDSCQTTMSVTMVPASHRTLFAMVTMTVTMEKMNMDALTALVIQTAISAMMAPASHRTVFAMVSITVTMEKMNMDALQTCSSAQFQCNDGSCIPDYWLCDGINDCAGNEDENEDSCQTNTCDPDSYVCYDGTCISSYSVCDGYYDCYYGEDEYGCSDGTCDPDSYFCYDGTCIPSYCVCDGFYNCYYGEDEYGCSASFRNYVVIVT
ncbi:putative low-density lipoprotein receptor-related protein 1B-like [Apostichopus japonicus]|uniref:Putative low-density lipoprotein receptor-related protein 1B-like n=1 Tax=Stichopus japonicus TaxID=307972 RepID=A0A2G8KA70_STIJA|nr:putative low-density lipoprotein receptor-related protein 1B-like [Apostichopus japonicus]